MGRASRPAMKKHPTGRKGRSRFVLRIVPG
jgi:hypothetical protein